MLTSVVVWCECSIAPLALGLWMISRSVDRRGVCKIDDFRVSMRASRVCVALLHDEPGMVARNSYDVGGASFDELISCSSACSLITCERVTTHQYACSLCRPGAAQDIDSKQTVKHDEAVDELLKLAVASTLWVRLPRLWCCDRTRGWLCLLG